MPGIYMVGGSLVVTGCTFINESANITVTDSGFAFGGSIYSANATVFAFGGAAYIVGTTTTITNCLFSACAAKGRGDTFSSPSSMPAACS